MVWKGLTSQVVPDTLNLAVRPSDDPRTRSSQQHHPLQSNVIDCIEAVDRYTLSCSSVYFLVFLLHFLFVPCVGLSWLSVSFLLHVKYTVSYRIVSCRLRHLISSCTDASTLKVPRLYRCNRFTHCCNNYKHRKTKWTKNNISPAITGAR